MKKLLGLVLICGLFLSGCGSSEETKDKVDKKTLTVLTSSGYAPYEIVDPKTKELVGFDIDVMNQAADIAGYKIKWVDMDFDGIIDSLKTDKGDVAMAGITPDSKRAKQVDFSDVYYAGEDSQNYILTLKTNKIKKTDDIKGITIGTQMGTIQESTLGLIQEDYNFNIDARKSYADLILEVQQGKLDAVLVEKAVAEEFTKKDDTLVAFKLEAGEELAGNAMAFKKGSKLKDEFNAAIKEMKENGTMDKLIDKYFK